MTAYVAVNAARPRSDQRRAELTAHVAVNAARPRSDQRRTELTAHVAVNAARPRSDRHRAALARGAPRGLDALGTSGALDPGHEQSRRPRVRRTPRRPRGRLPLKPPLMYGPGHRGRGRRRADRDDPQRRFPIVGDGRGVWSFVHIADAAAATLAAIEHGEPGVFNIVDDEPAPVAQWLPAAAQAVGAKKPRRLPRWLGRLAAGEGAVVMMTEVRGASNEKAKRELGWRLRYPSWRQGFVNGLGA